MRYFEIITAALVGVALTALLLGLSNAERTSASQSADGPIASVSVIPILEELIESDRYLPQREELQTRLQEERLNPLQEELRAFEEEFRRAQEEGGDVQAIRQRAQPVFQRLQQAQQEVNQQIQALLSEQIVEAYELIRTSADAVAEDLGYDYVIASTSQDEELLPNPNTLNAELAVRPVLVQPEDSDITEDVREDLNLE
jgi:Skp family chaperone for outer membrane proteins